MKKLSIYVLLIVVVLLSGVTIFLFSPEPVRAVVRSGSNPGIIISKPKDVKSQPKGCVFRTVFGEDSSKNMYVYSTPKNVTKAIDHALGWMVEAQQQNGGWGAGSHS